MRITRKKVSKAREVVAAAQEHAGLIKQWDSAVKQVDDPASVDAITVNGDGSVRFEIVRRVPRSDAKGAGHEQHD